MHRIKPRLAAILLVLLASAVCCDFAVAQNSSLFKMTQPVAGGPGLTLENSSLIYNTLPAPVGREIRVHDLVTIRVDQKADLTSEGNIQRRKNALYDAKLADWILLKGLKAFKPSAQPDGDPRANGQLNQLYRVQSELETTESLVFDITAEVTDIMPNGNLVLEAHDVVRINNETWERSLTGTCRRQDIDPGNVLLSKHIVHLDIFKRERGHVRDSYRRGWFIRWFDRFSPF